MALRMKIHIVVCTMLYTPLIVADQARMFFVPQGEDPADFPAGPTILQLRPGDSFNLEVFVDGGEGTLDQVVREAEARLRGRRQKNLHEAGLKKLKKAARRTPGPSGK